MDDSAWIDETLARAGHSVDADTRVYLDLMYNAFRAQLRAIDEADLGAVPPETDLDPSRAPNPL